MISLLMQEHLKISSGIDFIAMLGQQPRLKYLDFAITWIDSAVFEAVCNLKHLGVARMLIDQVSIRSFKELEKLSRLKELRLDSHTSYDCGHLLELSMMKCIHLEKLTLLCTERKIPEDILIQMSLNFRTLKHIELINRSIQIITTILENFPILESVLFDFDAIFGAPDDVLVIDENLKHENLKQIVVANINVNEIEITKALLKLISVCPNLQRIMLSQLSGVGSEEIRQILERHQHLTHLSLEFDSFDFDYDVISILQSCTKLVHVRLSGLTVYPCYTALQALFEETFPVINLYKFSSGGGEIVMKKRRTPDWHLNFKLLSHF